MGWWRSSRLLSSPWHYNITSWWFQPLRKNLVKMGTFPKYSGWKFQKYLSCHHPDYIVIKNKVPRWLPTHTSNRPIAKELGWNPPSCGVHPQSRCCLFMWSVCHNFCCKLQVFCGNSHSQQRKQILHRFSLKVINSLKPKIYNPWILEDSFRRF